MSSKARKSVDTRLAVYTAVAGALAAGAAHAAPTPSPNAPATLTDTTVNNSGVSLPFDIDGDGNTDFNLYVEWRNDCGINPPGQIRLNGQAPTAFARDTSGYAGMITPGTSIGSGQTYDVSTPLQLCYSDQGNFPAPSRGLVGVSFQIQGATHYAYLDIETATSSLEATIHEACYESEPRTSIQAGTKCRETAAIPVGGAIPLTLGVLALGAAALRRRRRLH